MTTSVKASTPAKSTRTVATKKTSVKTPTPKSAPLKTPTKIAAPKAKAPTAVKAPVSTGKVKPAKKPKLVRDSFTMPKDEYQAIDSLKQRATGLQRTAKKSELLRAGIMALSAMDDKNFTAILAKVPALKTGRPSGA